ncbi:monocarboxylate transporter 12-like [Mizuhopecten yessoensis]|uniref:monocarboxylate transporter 12-like n=1 Tax=Mizuhopecten yessoensis TaxID=6573 RepID=UPI000B45DAC3|nr:monocarboxylate transporter 12-like [Mizuhopecten yessoensis]XP_021365487.1 monocarboxylate transporter 12-like [Mizuhopecten yessoensis]XP_021365488.1 monocarboxylate transporter 12-like [Mizuhopecten yessoensis]XP_021365489.1 monocarboxylate transporter 12-like [Mizuhopecten yessoensis]XP_021365490.1 monocarboxylate transporter 12-like [Mizuhopecten yessoensis]
MEDGGHDRDSQGEDSDQYSSVTKSGGIEEEGSADHLTQLLEIHEGGRPPSPGSVGEEEKQEYVVPDRGWGWWCVLGCALAHFVTSGMERSGGVILLELQERFESGAAATAWVISLSATCRLLFGPVASILSNKYSCRTVVIVGGLLVSIGVFVSGFGPNITFLYFSYGLFCGLGKSLAYTPGLVIVGQYFKKKRGLAVGLATAGGGVGTLLIPPAINRLFKELRFTGAMMILSGLALQLCIAGCLYMPLEKYRALCLRRTADPNATKRLSLQNDKDTTVLHSNPKTKFSLLGILKCTLCSHENAVKSPQQETKKKLIDCSLLNNPLFTSLCIAILFLALAFSSVLVFIPSLADFIGLTRLQGAFILSIAGIFDTIGRLVSGVVLDVERVKKFRMLVYNSAVFLLSTLTFVLAYVTTFVQLAIIAALYGLLIGTYTSQKTVILADILGSGALSSSFGILICFQGVGTLLGPPITGFLKDNLDSFAVGFYVAAAINFLGALILLTGNIYQYTKTSKRTKTDNLEMDDA